MRISYGVQWSERIDNAIQIIGKLVHDYPEHSPEPSNIGVK